MRGRAVAAGEHMNRGRVVLVLTWLGILTSLGTGTIAVGAKPQAAPAAKPSAQAQRALVDKYCVGCHNEKGKARVRDFVLENADLSNVAAHPDVWEKVIKKLRAGQMPPIGAQRPDQTSYVGLIRSLESELDR